MESIVTAFIVGVLASIGHCVAMCGGIVGVLTVGLEDSIKTNKLKVMQYHLVYNLGRILSYVLMGLLLGAIGSVLVEMTVFDKGLRIISGVLMIMIGLTLSQWWFGLQKIEKIGARIWAKIQPITHKILPVTSFKKSFMLGLLWGYLPCGVVYSMLALAMASGSSLYGGFLMFAFALGTLPALLLMGNISSMFISFNKKPIVKKIAGLLIIIMGILAVLMPLKSLLWTH